MYSNQCREHSFNKSLVLAAAIVIWLMSSTAWAVAVKTDKVKINFGTADFGWTNHVLGAPGGDGQITWDFSTVNGSLRASATVTGFLFLDSVDPGCSRLTIEFKNSSGTVLATRNKEVCVTTTGHNANDKSNQLFVEESFGSSDLDQVVLRTHSVVNGQIASTSPPFVSKAPDIKDHSLIVNSENADFGNGLHAGGGPTGSATVEFKRDNGNVKGTVSGTLYYDSLFSEGCAQLTIEFEDSSGSVLKSSPVKKCGPGGNANDAVNKTSVNESFSNGSLFKIRLRAGQVLPDGSLVRVKSITCDFAQCAPAQ